MLLPECMKHKPHPPPSPRQRQMPVERRRLPLTTPLEHRYLETKKNEVLVVQSTGGWRKQLPTHEDLLQCEDNDHSAPSNYTKSKSVPNYDLLETCTGQRTRSLNGRRGKKLSLIHSLMIPVCWVIKIKTYFSR